MTTEVDEAGGGDSDEVSPEVAEAARLLRNHVAGLMEHFECVQVFVSRQSGHGTFHMNLGAGNYYARYGQCREWVTKLDAVARMQVMEGDVDE